MSDSGTSRSDVLVIGAGLGGLTAARRLRAGGLTVTVVDKGRAPGGRLAGRRFPASGGGEAMIDYGAQYFTARHPEFRREIAQWVKAGVASEWSRGFHLADGTFKETGEPRFRGVPRMRAIADHLADGLPIHPGVRVESIAADGDGWAARGADGSAFFGRALLVTAPLPQTLALLDDSGIALPARLHAALSAISYRPCLALMAVLDGPSALVAPGGVWLDGDPAAWVADNRLKGVSGSHTGITVHGGPEFSREAWDAHDDEVTAILLDAARPWLNDAAVLATRLHRWRYAFPERIHDRACEMLEEPAPLVLAGDAFVSPRMEGAWRSGMAAAETLAALLAAR